MCSVRAKSGCRIVKLLCPPLRCRMFRRKKLGNLAVFFFFFEREIEIDRVVDYFIQ